MSMTTTAYKLRQQPRQGGFSILEVMIALFISLMMLAAVIAVFANTRQSFYYQQSVNELNDNIRTAISAMTHDLRMAGHWGGASRAPRADDFATGGGNFKNTYLDGCTGFSPHMHKLSTDTSTGLFPISVDSSSVVKNPTPGTTATSTDDCLYRQAPDEKTDILSIIYAEPQVVADADLVNGGIYQRTRVGFAPALFAGTGDPDDIVSKPTSRFPPGSDLQTAFNLPLRITHYLVSRCGDLGGGPCPTGNPTLYQSITSPAGVGFEYGIAPGVEALSFLMMADTLGDGDSVKFLNSTDLIAETALGNNPFDTVQAITIQMVIKAGVADNALTDNTLYELAEMDYQPSGIAQKFHRKLVTSTVYLRNNIQR